MYVLLTLFIAADLLSCLSSNLFKSSFQNRVSSLFEYQLLDFVIKYA